jgi:hypothetical protein
MIGKSTSSSISSDIKVYGCIPLEIMGNMIKGSILGKAHSDGRVAESISQDNFLCAAI